MQEPFSKGKTGVAECIHAHAHPVPLFSWVDPPNLPCPYCYSMQTLMLSIHCTLFFRLFVLACHHLNSFNLLINTYLCTMATVACGAIPTGTSGTGKAWTQELWNSWFLMQKNDHEKKCKRKNDTTQNTCSNMSFLDSRDLIQLHLSPDMQGPSIYIPIVTGFEKEYQKSLKSARGSVKLIF